MSRASSGNSVRRSFVATLVVYNVLLAAFAIYTLMRIWPTSSSDSLIEFLGFSFQVPSEVRLMLIVIMAGALGSFVHAATSLVTYVGNRKFVGSWASWYFVRPLIGSSLALIFYFAFRGGMLQPVIDIKDINLFGVAALSGLVGMFSKEATDKLAEVFRTFFENKEDAKRHNKLTD